MKKYVLICLCTAFLSASTLHGQDIPPGNTQSAYKSVIIHKQTGEVLKPTDLYNLSRHGGAFYTFKVSGDTIYHYYDEDPQERNEPDSGGGPDSKIGKPANLGTFQDISGQAYTQEDLNENVVVLNFWATWCSPCIAEIPELNRVVEKFKDKKVLFFAPTLETGRRLDDFRARIDFDYRIVPKAGEISEEYKSFSLPTHIVIDKNGIVRFIQVGTDTDTIYKVLSKEIKKCL